MSVDAALNAARRLTFGPTAGLLAEIRAKGVTTWLEEQLNPESINDLDTELLVDQYTYPLMPTAVLIDSGTTYEARDQQRSTVTISQIMSNRQVYEVMAEFWANHFSIDGNNLAAVPWRAGDDRNVARKYALATFPELLRASSKSPAMLRFLNNDVSSGNNPNLNYGRELMELHTVGVHGGYNQDDVHQASLALTGWTVEPYGRSFYYDHGRHYVGPLKVMGWRHANKEGDGVAVGESLISYLATHPSTARHLATKLVRRFVADNPPGGLTSRVAGALQDSGFDIKTAIRTIVSSKEFLSTAGGKYRRPAEWYVASLRAVGSRPSFGLFPPDSHPVLAPLAHLGQLPFGWTPPNGYPDVAAEWVSTSQSVSRWNIALQIAHNNVPSMTGYKQSDLLPGAAPKTAGELVDRLAVSVLGQAAALDERAAILELIAKTPGAAVTDHDIKAHIVEIVAMLLSSPSMQVR